ncbi:MAG: tripartite tricarboxylate transporter TctB family protein [Kiloniellales bacterium]
MKITRDRMSALFFLALSIAYYLGAMQVELYPGDEEELINAQTFPKFIGVMAGIFSFLILVLPAKGEEEKIDWAGFDWVRPVLLCALMVGYGLTIKWPGFFLATSFFLICGILVLGERRWWAVLVASIPVAAGFEFILDGLLDIYIEDPFVIWLGLQS